MSFNLLDLLIVVAAVMAGVGGYRIGFVTRVTSWIGLGLGLAVAARFLPKVVDRFHFETPSSRLLLAAGVLVVGASSARRSAWWRGRTSTPWFRWVRPAWPIASSARRVVRLGPPV